MMTFMFLTLMNTPGQKFPILVHGPGHELAIISFCTLPPIRPLFKYAFIIWMKLIVNEELVSGHLSELQNHSDADVCFYL